MKTIYLHMQFKKTFQYYFGTIIGFALLIITLIPFVNSLIAIPVLGFCALLTPLSKIGILSPFTLSILYLFVLIAFLILEYAYQDNLTKQKVGLIVYYFLHFSILFLIVSIIHARTEISNSFFLMSKIAIPLPLIGICFDLTMKKYSKRL